MADIPNDELFRLAKKEEPRLLNIILKNKECMMDLISSIKPEYFWVNDNKFLYSVILKNYEKYKSTLTRSAMDVIMDMQDSYTDDQRSARKMYWDQVYSLDCSKEDYNLLKSSISSRHAQKQMYKILHENLNTIVNSTSGQIELIRKIQNDVVQIDGLNTDSYCLVMNMKDGLEKSMDHIINRREHPEDNAGIMTGLKGLDEAIMGFVPGSYNIITGLINGGKTTLMFNMAFNMAKAGYSVIYVSIEKELVQFYTRLLSLHALVDYNRIRKGGKGDYGVSEDTFQRLKDAKDDLDNNIHPNFEGIQAAQQTTLTKILSMVEPIRLSKKVDVLFLDYLGVVGFETHHPTRPDLDLANVSERLQAYGRIHKLTVITAMQIKNSSTKDIRNKAKKVEDNNDIIEVNTEDMAGAQKVAADCDSSLYIGLNKDNPPTKATIHITKGRDNQNKMNIEFDFDGRLGRIADPELEPGQIKRVDQILYNKQVTTEQIMSEDNLFEQNNEETQEKSPIDAKTCQISISNQPQVEPMPEEHIKEVVKINEKKPKKEDDDIDIILGD